MGLKQASSITNETVNRVNQKLKRAPPNTDSHIDPGIEKLCKLLAPRILISFGMNVSTEKQNVLDVGYEIGYINVWEVLVDVVG